MNKKNIIVSQAGQIVKLNNEVDRLKMEIHDLKKCFVDDMRFVNEALDDLDVEFENGKLTLEKFVEIQGKVSLRMNPYRYCFDNINVGKQEISGSFLKKSERGE